MIGLLQRVLEASVTVDGQCIARIPQGLLVLIGVQPTDTLTQAQRLFERIMNYRIFADDDGRMNRSLRDVRGGLLLVPQFTLAADTQSGTRPGFSTAAAPELARSLFEALVLHGRENWPETQCGQFGADMQVGLINNGPVTFWIETH